MQRLGTSDNSFDALFLNAAQRYCPAGWEPWRLAAVLKAICAVESGGSFDPQTFARDDGGTGRSAVGLMQLNSVAVADVRERAPELAAVAEQWPALAAAQGAHDPRLDPAWSVDVAARYLVSMRTRYGHADLRECVGCYNGGPSHPVASYADRVMALVARYSATDVADNAALPRPADAYAVAVQAIVAEARACAALPVPYRFGGADRAGCDCSGLVQHCYALAGLTTARVAEAQFEAAAPLDVDSAGAADLVFFWGTDPSAPDGTVSHVGLWLGDGQMIHAPGEGAVVKVQPVTGNGFWDNLRRAWGRPPALADLAAGPDCGGGAGGLTAGSMARVDTDGLNLRAGAGVDQRRLATLGRNADVLVTGGPLAVAGRSWWQVLSRPGFGWVAGEFLAVAGEAPEPAVDEGAVVVGTGGEALNVREQPDPTTGVLLRLADGDRVTVVGGPADGGGRRWWRVRRGLIEGWAAADWLRGVPASVSGG